MVSCCWRNCCRSDSSRCPWQHALKVMSSWVVRSACHGGVSCLTAPVAISSAISLPSSPVPGYELYRKANETGESPQTLTFPPSSLSFFLHPPSTPYLQYSLQRTRCVTKWKWKSPKVIKNQSFPRKECTCLSLPSLLPFTITESNESISRMQL